MRKVIWEIPDTKQQVFGIPASVKILILRTWLLKVCKVPLSIYRWLHSVTVPGLHVFHVVFLLLLLEPN